MSKYKFNPTERFAIFSTHGEKCYLCTAPLDLKTMEVDHVIPESLIEKPAELHAALKSLGRPADFEVNSFANWLPACKSCNGKKNDHVFSPSPLIQLVLENAAAKAPEVEKFAAETVSKRKIANALNVLERANEEEKLDDETIEVLAAFLLHHRQPELIGKAIRFTPFYEALAVSNGIQIVRISGHGHLGRIETINKATDTITTASMLISSNPNDYEYNPVNGVISSKSRGL